MPSRMALTIQHMNRFLANSDVRTRVRLAGLEPVDYDVRSNHTQYQIAFGRMVNREDGYFDDIPALRERTGADVVALLLGNSNPEGAEAASVPH